MYLTSKLGDMSRAAAAGIGSSRRALSDDLIATVRTLDAQLDGLRIQLTEARQQRDEAAEKVAQLEESVVTPKPADDATQHEAAVARLIAAYPWLDAHPAHVRQLARAALGQVPR